MRKRLYTRPVTLMLSDEMYLKIEDITDKEETSFSRWIRDAIQQKLDMHCSKKSEQSTGKTIVREA